MSRVWVTDVGMVTALGDAQSTWESLMAGRCGIAPVRRFPIKSYATGVAGCISMLDNGSSHSRLDTLVELLFADLTVPQDAHLLIASTKGAIDQLERSLRGQATALDRVLAHQVVDHIAAQLGCTGPRRCISAACASATMAMGIGAARIACDQADVVLICGLDIVSEFIFAGFSALKALSAAPSRPFDAGREGLSLGEAGAYLLLMNDERCRRENRTPVGEIVGWGMASDAHHLTAPSRTGDGLVAAVHEACQRTATRGDVNDIGAVNAHGTGSLYNDAMELTAFQRLFNSPIPLHSVKGALGHTMGASGAVEAIVGLASLWHGAIPPTVGLHSPDPQADGWVADRSQPLVRDCLLTTNSGFGGVNAALVLRAGERACF